MSASQMLADARKLARLPARRNVVVRLRGLGRRGHLGAHALELFGAVFRVGVVNDEVRLVFFFFVAGFVLVVRQLLRVFLVFGVFVGRGFVFRVELRGLEGGLAAHVHLRERVRV